MVRTSTVAKKKKKKKKKGYIHFCGKMTPPNLLHGDPAVLLQIK